METVRAKSCSHDSCSRRSSFKIEGSKDGMVNVGPTRFSCDVLATEVQYNEEQQVDGVLQAAWWKARERRLQLRYYLILNLTPRISHEPETSLQKPLSFCGQSSQDDLTTSHCDNAGTHSSSYTL